MSTLLEVEDLWIRYEGGYLLARRAHEKVAVRGVSFAVAEGQTFGLVGESGSGKSSVGKAILRLVQPSSGAIRFDGQDIVEFGRKTPLSYRGDVQVIFQDPWSSLNARAPIGRILAEPMRRHGRVAPGKERHRVVELLERVGLAPNHADRLPSQLSGGQRQRVAIARALAVEPRLIVCDEPVSALDVSTQGQVINLLQDLQEQLGLTYVFIAHDLGVVRHISQQIGVMASGELVETGLADDVYLRPQHSYTRALIDAEPLPDPDYQRERRRARRTAAQNTADAVPGTGSGPAR
ncbi:ABC transporter ATP-binding protein [Frankia sp. CNm7]|uniref:ABC transporter ATP-binding protein n=1 Tax=Frankia nepalensis TaxID=1836974 RepID=A0A937RR52_9ACTN|nr:ATP-binding cassette domain-containing protein [Frankia nepalensis]MBL7501992.1 ABC transporter ATP-binding protein [Frankia nepalensis]MBL7510622.1 ABC transporter ATP-binding protein [Frankia nepalensis]MBL7517362.1 ABC transporter ATP-binding protein [Frankia nepalensis]MBL7633445.1 ABC transporter ATP-binding protein [Frankia nepalensis]